jgi:hypothetical protein
VITCSIACATEIDDGNNDEINDGFDGFDGFAGFAGFSAGGIRLV